MIQHIQIALRRHTGAEPIHVQKDRRIEQQSRDPIAHSVGIRAEIQGLDYVIVVDEIALVFIVVSDILQNIEIMLGKSKKRLARHDQCH